MGSTISPINLAALSGTIDSTVAMTEIRLPDGSRVRIETDLLLSGSRYEAPSENVLLPDDGVTVIPLIEERLVVGRQVVETGKVRLIKGETVYEEQLNEPLLVSTFEVERVVLNQHVEEMPAIRQEGATTIYPVVEEELILTKRLILSEEVRVTRRETEQLDTRVVTLRRETLTVEREDLKN